MGSLHPRFLGSLGLASGQLRGLLSGLHGCLLLRLKCALLRRKLSLTFRFRGTGGIRLTPRLRGLSSFGFVPRAPSFFFNGFLDAKTGLFSGLRPRGREIPVLGAVQIGP